MSGESKLSATGTLVIGGIVFGLAGWAVAGNAGLVLGGALGVVLGWGVIRQAIPAALRGAAIGVLFELAVRVSQDA